MSGLRPGEIATFTLRVAQVKTDPPQRCAPGEKLVLSRDGFGLCLRSRAGATVGHIPERYAGAMQRYLELNPHNGFDVEVQRTLRSGLWLRFAVPLAPEVHPPVAPSLLTTEPTSMYIC